jgi:phosphorylase kinase alpha/beta subunit
MMNKENSKVLLDKYFQSIDKIILSRQDPMTGLLPASTAVNVHGDYTDAWVRDNVYSILCVWGLSLAYKKNFPNHYRTHILGQSVVKLMRGLLISMMRQSDRVEAYKKSHNPIDALHAKYGTDTGLAVVGDNEWGHLQLDATSLFVLMIAQMSASGLSLIYTIDEVNFVQNLVHYIGRTYSTPDYGIWERGNKINHGTTEINCSSVGMAKAALEAINGFNLFGESSSSEGVIHVVLNDITRSRVTLKGLLPRESNSKEIDAALLSIIGYPAYAVEDKKLVEKTRNKIIDKLAGRYGCKRFLLDGHQSLLEDSSRLHYEPSELRDFKHIESEWPLFFTYLLLDALMRDDREAIVIWRERLEPLFIEVDGERLLPELYFVPKESIEAEKAKPYSQERVANENLPLVWAQSLYLLSDMILQGAIESEEIDPLHRRHTIGRKTTSTPLVCIISENQNVKESLFEFGVESETLHEIEPINCMHASELAMIHSFLGKNEKLGLSGRDILTHRSITTSRLHLLQGEQTLFFPYYFNPKAFYFSFDNKLLVQHYKSSVRFLASYWTYDKSPIVPFLVREDMLRDHSKDVIIKLLLELQTNSCESVTTKIIKTQELMEYAYIEQIDTISTKTLKELKSHGVGINEEEYGLAAIQHDWTQVRSIAQKNEIYDVRIEDALLDILTAQKRLAVGRAYSDEAIFSKPKTAVEIMKSIDKYCGNNEAERVLTQEIILHLGHLIRTREELFKNMITLRTGDCIQLLVGHISRDRKISIGDAYTELLRFAPHGIYETLCFIFESYSMELQQLRELENLHVHGIENIDMHLITTNKKNIKIEDWAHWREKVGMIGSFNSSFYKEIWYILQQCNGLVIGDKYSIKSRIGSELTLESTAGERSFELKIDTLLQGIQAASYRQLNIEIIESLFKLFQANPELIVEDDLILDILIGYAVKIAWEANNEGIYDEYKGEAWNSFYKLSRLEVQESFFKAFVFLIKDKKAS